MAQGNISKLPKLGEITLPVHLMVYEDKKNPNKDFMSNFCFWKAADGASDVTDNEGREIGSIGGTMGGHVEMNRYYPYKQERSAGSSYDQWINVIIDVRDMWEQIEKMLDTPGAKVIIEGLEEIQEKYQALKAKERNIEEARKAKLDEIRQMQKEAEKSKENEKKTALGSIMGSLLAVKKQEIEEKNVVRYWIGKMGVIEDGGWDLTKRIDTPDHSYIEDDGEIIPTNYGTGIKVIDEEGQILTSPEPEKAPEVELRISTWMGTSVGAIHYYGVLEFHSPWLQFGDHRTTAPYDLRILGTNKIELTHPLEAWELRDYKDSYKGWRVGDHYRGFYTVDDVIKVGKEFFKEYFEKGWKLKITEL
jgi:hypothetical protein